MGHDQATSGTPLVLEFELLMLPTQLTFHTLLWLVGKLVSCFLCPVDMAQLQLQEGCRRAAAPGASLGFLRTWSAARKCQAKVGILSWVCIRLKQIVRGCATDYFVKLWVFLDLILTFYFLCINAVFVTFVQIKSSNSLMYFLWKISTKHFQRKTNTSPCTLLYFRKSEKKFCFHISFTSDFSVESGMCWRRPHL